MIASKDIADKVSYGCSDDNNKLTLTNIGDGWIRKESNVHDLSNSSSCYTYYRKAKTCMK